MDQPAWWGKDSNLRRRYAGRFTVCSVWPLRYPTLTRPEGVEPPTFGSVVQRSIQLSYGRTLHHAHERTRTSTPFPALVPQTSLSANSSTWAEVLGPAAERPVLRGLSFRPAPAGADRPARQHHARRGTRTLTRLPPQDPESCASANSAIRARNMELRGVEPLTS